MRPLGVEIFRDSVVKDCLMERWDVSMLVSICNALDEREIMRIPREWRNGLTSILLS